MYESVLAKAAKTDLICF